MNKRFVIVSCMIILVLSGILGVFVINKLKPNDVDIKDNPNYVAKKTIKTYEMFVKINPLVRLTFEVEYEPCKDSLSGEDTVCATQNEKVTGFELINDDAKNIYDKMDFKGKKVLDVLSDLCEVARDNKVAYKSINVTTNWDYMYEDEVIKKTIEQKTKGKIDFDIFVDIKEFKSEDKDKIVEELETEKKDYIIVTFDRDNGDRAITKKIEKGESIEEIKPGEKKGYKFVEWTLDGKKFDFKSVIEENITLKAKWEKEETTTTTTTTQVKQEESKKEETTTTTTSTTTTTTTTTTKAPNYSSRINKINLNENILVNELVSSIYSSPSSNSHSCSYGSMYMVVFATNANEVYKDYGYKNHFEASRSPLLENKSYDEMSDLCDTIVPEFEAKIKDLKYDSAKENKAKSILDKFKNNSLVGIGDVSYSLVGGHGFSYNIEYLDMANANKFGEFGKEFNSLNSSEFKELNKLFKDAIYISSYCTGGCGTSNEPDPPQILNEKLCKKYNLTCDRW